jgi:hypothetical protein
MIPTPNQAQIQTALRNFLVAVLPPGVPVVQGQDNRVPEPAGTDFVVMWPLGRPRLATNIDTYVDAVFTGFIAGTTLTITAVNPKYIGKIAVGSTIFGPKVTPGTAVTAFGSGTGGLGTYQVSPSQTAASAVIAAGTQSLLQETEIVMQLDVHGPNSSDNAQVISTMMRDEVAFRYFKPSSTGVSPLYADDPKQIPFLNAEQQYESRYVVEAHMQAQQAVIIPQEFFDEIEVDLINVDAAYPAL